MFSNMVACAMTVQGRTEETIRFVKHMNDFFTYCLINANKVFTKFQCNSINHTPDDRRLAWLKTEFLKYFQNWEKWAMSQTDVPAVNDCKKYFYIYMRF